MLLRIPDYYKKFKCIADRCSDTCCAGWQVEIDPKTYEYYMGLTGEFGDRLKNTIDKTGDTAEFINKPNNDCPCLNDKHYCDLYTALGEEHLCETCMDFPRHIEEYRTGKNGIDNESVEREIGISFSCPEASRIILTNPDKIKFIEEEYETFARDKIKDTRLATYVCSLCEFENEEEEDQSYTDLMMELRDCAIELVQNREYNISDRISMLLMFANETQNLIDHNNKELIPDLIKQYRDTDELECRINKAAVYANCSTNGRRTIIDSYLLYLEECEVINSRWPQYLELTRKVLYGNVEELDDDTLEFSVNAHEYISSHQQFEQYYSENSRMYEYEHLMVYYIFRYFMTAIYDDDVLSKIKKAIVSYVVINEVDVAAYVKNGRKLSLDEQMDIFHLYSREIEHSDINFEELQEEIMTNELYNYEHMMRVIALVR